MDDLGERLKVTADQRGQHSYRWQRLGIFLALAVAFIILLVVAMGTIHTGLDGNREREFARLITKVGWKAIWGSGASLPCFLNGG
jgi:hypothetical protein